jgi:AraC-like DNA-binding protein
MPFLTETTSDVDQARTIIGRHFYINFIDQLSQAPEWEARFDIAAADPLTLGDLSFGVDIRMRLGELGAYHIDVPIGGALHWHQGSDRTRTATRNNAAVFQPVGDTVLERWTGDCRLLAVKIEQRALEDQLAELLDAPVRGPIRFAPTLDLSSGAGASWRRLLRLLAADAVAGDGLLHHPVVGAQLRESLAVGWLLATDHQYRDVLHGPNPALAAPRTVRRAVEAMRADPGRPYTVAELARIAGISSRSLQQSFRRYTGMPPMAYLRDVRLSLAHDRLSKADPRAATVAGIAYQTGFMHLGRFAAAYRNRYGVSPGQTLHHEGRIRRPVRRRTH